MGTGLHCGFATASGRGILQRAHEALVEEIAKNSGHPCDGCLNQI
jgi:hypothetical protein